MDPVDEDPVELTSTELEDEPSAVDDELAVLLPDDPVDEAADDPEDEAEDADDAPVLAAPVEEDGVMAVELASPELEEGMKMDEELRASAELLLESEDKLLIPLLPLLPLLPPLLSDDAPELEEAMKMDEELSAPAELLLDSEDRLLMPLLPPLLMPLLPPLLMPLLMPLLSEDTPELAAEESDDEDSGAESEEEDEEDSDSEDDEESGWEGEDDEESCAALGLATSAAATKSERRTRIMARSECSNNQSRGWEFVGERNVRWMCVDGYGCGGVGGVARGECRGGGGMGCWRRARVRGDTSVRSVCAHCAPHCGRCPRDTRRVAWRRARDRVWRRGHLKK